MIIEFSGVDGSGKTTQVERLFRSLNERGLDCYQRDLRSGHKRILGEIARSRGHGHWKGCFSVDEVEIAHALEMLAMALRDIYPLDSMGVIVVTDTYLARWLATAEMWGAEKMELIAEIYGQLPKPTISFHLQVNLDLAFKRLSSRPKGDHALSLKNQGKLERYERGFQRAAKYLLYERTVLSTEEPIERTADVILQAVLANQSIVKKLAAPVYAAPRFA